MKSLVRQRAPVLVVGTTGTGKTSIIKGMLEGLDSQWLTLVMNFSYATTSEEVQESIEVNLAKRQGRRYGPAGAKARLVVFIDDLNMPQRTEFGSQPPIELLRLWLDYGLWYDRKAAPHATVKYIMDTQLVAAMGPPEGSRSPLCPRFQGKFNLINFTFPSDAQLKRIYRTLISNHLSQFEEGVKQQNVALAFTQATLELYKQVVEVFKPIPACPHYTFNMRDMSKVVQGLLQSDPRYFDSRESMVKLWVHECLRVFHDRLVTPDDREKLLDMINSKLALFDINWKRLFKDPKILPVFSDMLEEDITAAPVSVSVVADAKDLKGGGDIEQRPPYVEVTNKRALIKNLLEEKARAMDVDPSYESAALAAGKVGGDQLVLFGEAIDHVLRVHRIITQPRGSALLIGVGGSGRQVLARLAAYTAGMKIKQIRATRSYQLADFREDLKELYRQCGVREEATVLLLSDTQLVQESFLVDVNSILQSGEVPKLFTPDEMAPILEELKEKATRRGLPTTTEFLSSWFIERVRDHLHVVLCMSPVGGEFRTRIRNFPALVNCTTVDWFSDWGEEALHEVASRFIDEAQVGGKRNKDALAKIFSSMHTSAVKATSQMWLELKRQNYTTPTKYLDLVKSYHSLLTEKRQQLNNEIDKLRNGILRLEEGSAQVQQMEVELAEKYRKLKHQQQMCDKLMLDIGQKRRAESEQRKLVEVDTARLEEEQKVYMEEARSAQEELDKVMPALEKAMKAIDKLSKAAITEIKSYAKPPKPVEKVMSAVMVLLEKEVES